jgi:hypothetical protein
MSRRIGRPMIRVAGVGLALLLAACSSAGTAAPSAIPTVSPSPIPSAAASPSVAATAGPCDPAKLAARITLWEGAAGSRIAHVELTNAGSAACLLPGTARPQLVDGKGSVLIDGAAPASPSPAASAPTATLALAAGGVVKTLVRAGNYCGPAATAPVSPAFVLASGGRFVATPVSPTDAGVPPCLGAPGSAGTVEMQPWAP